MSRLEETYFHWLTSQIKLPKGRTYKALLERLHEVNFAWIVPNDDNRVQDGLDLRHEFSGQSTRGPNHDLISILELIIALSRHASFTAGGESNTWAWQLIRNLGLQKMSDPLTHRKMVKIDEILDRLIWRTYEPNGHGGFFPLYNPEEDQTKVEIWYQLNAYINEMDQR